MIRKPVIFNDSVFYDVSIDNGKKTKVKSIFNNQQGKKDSGKQKILLTNIEVPIVNDLDKGTYNFKQISAFCTNNAIIGSIEINKKGKYTLLCKINSDGIFEVRDKDGKIQYQPRKYVADKSVQSISTVTASLKKSENEKKELEDKVYEIESLIGDIEETLNSEMPCYIEKGEQKDKFINDLKKYKEMKWFDKVIADINKEKENIKAEFKSIIDIKESYTDFDTKISSRRAEAKKLFDEYKKTTKSKNKDEDPHMKEIYNNFIAGAKNVRKKFEGITDRTKSIRNSDLWNDFDKIYNEFIESFNSSQKN